jgi:hypothetical protein
MPENVHEYTIHEYGPDVISGLDAHQKIKFKDTTYQGVHILEEAEPLGTQHLKTEDIKEELDKLPKNIRKYITSIVLAPFTHPHQDWFDRRSGREGNAFASANPELLQITIYAIPQERNVLKDTLAKHFTLAHEAGHLIDGKIQPPEFGFFAYTPTWSKAICEDSRVKRNREDLPSFLVSSYAEELKSLRDDFADSVMYFSDEGGYKEFLKENFPNRFRLLEGFLGEKGIL